MNLYFLAADIIVVLHVLYMAAILLGLLLPIPGYFLGWKFIRKPWFRLLPLVMMGIVFFEAWNGIQCPLTTWEDDLRLAGGGTTTGESFVGRCFQDILFWDDFPNSGFKWLYTGLFVLIAATWVFIPPQFRRKTFKFEQNSNEDGMKIFFSVGEPSGDTHGANLIRELQRRCPGVRCTGFGGPKMREAGCEILFDLTSLAVMWVGQVLRNLRKFYALADQAEAWFQTEKPNAVVLVDYPGFNWHIARRAKRLGIPVFYYSPPQVWAWRPGRVKKLRKFTDCVFSGLPFEAHWLEEHGVHVKYVGHPFFDEAQRPISEEPLEIPGPADAPILALLPGSRTQEVRLNFPVFLRVIRILRKNIPHLRFVVAAFSEAHAEMIRELLEKDTNDVTIFVHRTPEILRAATCCLSVSGSVSLELLNHEKPAVIVYQISSLAWWIQWYFRRAKFITLVNLLAADHPFARFRPEYTPSSPDASQVVYPEYLTSHDRSAWIAADLENWFLNESARLACVEQLHDLKSRYALPGAASRAAEEICRFIEPDCPSSLSQSNHETHGEDLS